MAWFTDLGWSDSEIGLYEQWSGGDMAILNDPEIQRMFNAGWFETDLPTEQRRFERANLIAAVEDRYGIDFRHAFNYSAWRELYAGGLI